MGKLTDLHCHILPGMDDGSRDVEMSIEMLRRQAVMGVTTVCASSHYYAEQNGIEEFCIRRQKALDSLENKLTESMPEIVPGAEVAFFSGIEECRDLERLCIQGTRTLLLEMPFCDWNSLQKEALYVLSLDRDFDLVLVHPERFCFSTGNRNILKKLCQIPVGFQVNADTLLHWRSRKQGIELLNMASIPLLGSDCHDLMRRAPNLAQGRDVVGRKLGAKFLQRVDEFTSQLAFPEFEEA